MAISYDVEGVKIPTIKKREVTSWIKAVIDMHGRKVGSIGYVFCSDEKILEINKEYLQHDYYTDIITFNYNEGDTVSGDIFISLDTVKSNSVQYNTDYNEELHRVIIHGILHLCGINDKTEKEQAEMTDNEDKALKLINL